MIGAILGVASAAFKAVAAYMNFKNFKQKLKIQKDNMKNIVKSIRKKDKVNDIKRKVQKTKAKSIKKEGQEIMI